MRKILILLLILFLVTIPAAATQYTAPQAPDSVEDLMPVDTETFGEGLWKIIINATAKLRPELKEAAGVCLAVIATVMLISVLRLMPGISTSVVEFSGVLAICIILVSTTGSMIRLGAQTVTELSEYGKLLLPVMTGAMAASGAAASSAALYTSTAAFDAVLGSLIGKILVPTVYVFLVLSIAAAATSEEMLKKLRDLVKWLMSWSLKTLLYIFTGYMGITGVVSGATDAAALKATKLTIAGMVPMVGGILSEASDAVLVGAGVVKSAVGVYGLLAISAIWISPFLKIGIQYLLLKLTGAVCASFGSKTVTDILAAFTTAMGILLAMTGSVCFLLLVSTVCFMRGVG